MLALATQYLYPLAFVSRPPIDKQICSRSRMITYYFSAQLRTSVRITITRKNWCGRSLRVDRTDSSFLAHNIFITEGWQQCSCVDRPTGEVCAFDDSNFPRCTSCLFIHWMYLLAVVSLISGAAGLSPAAAVDESTNRSNSCHQVLEQEERDRKRVEAKRIKEEERMVEEIDLYERGLSARCCTLCSLT